MVPRKGRRKERRKGGEFFGDGERGHGGVPLSSAASGGCWYDLAAGRGGFTDNPVFDNVPWGYGRSLL